jgi:hypothetical protein
MQETLESRVAELKSAIVHLCRLIIGDTLEWIEERLQCKS